MSEEEIIKIIKYMLENKNTDVNVIINYEAIQGLLDLYNKEKEKEKNLLKQLKDSEKELLEVTQNVVSKDRINELIFYIDNDIKARDFRRIHMQHTTTDSYEVVYSASGVKEMLKRLLEEKKLLEENKV